MQPSYSDLRAFVGYGPQVSVPEHSSSDVAVASDAARAQRRKSGRMKAAMGAVKPMEETMRVLTQTELARMTRIELMSLLRRISAALPDLAEGSAELRESHVNLVNIRRVLVRPPGPAPRP